MYIHICLCSGRHALKSRLVEVYFDHNISSLNSQFKFFYFYMYIFFSLAHFIFLFLLQLGYNLNETQLDEAFWKFKAVAETKKVTAKDQSIDMPHHSISSIVYLFNLIQTPYLKTDFLAGSYKQGH